MNKKGFTVVEVLVSFTLVAIISIFLFQIIYIVRNTYIEKTTLTKLFVNKNSLSNVVNKDIFFYNDVDPSYYIQLEKINVIDNTRISFINDDDNEKELAVDKENNTIKYGDFVVNYPKGTELSDIFYDYYVESGTEDLCYYNFGVNAKYPGYDYNFGINIFIESSCGEPRVRVGG